MAYRQRTLSPWFDFRRALGTLVLGATAAALVACGGGSMAPGASAGLTPPATAPGTSKAQSCTSTTCGGALLTLTDAAGAFQSYLVTVTSLQLTRSDGTVVETLSNPTQVDFTQLVNLSELVSSAQLPLGQYTSAAMTLDYSSAQLVLTGATAPVPLAGVYLGSATSSVAAGNARLTVSLSLGATNALTITPATVQHLALDFNLDTSNVIATTSGTTTVTVQPVLTGSLAPDPTKQTHVRGPLVSVATPANDGSGSFVLSVRPFDDDQGNNGQFTIDTSPATTFTISGSTTTGGAGLKALSAALAGAGSTPLVVAAYGSLDIASMTFTATSVQAGASVVGSVHDGIQGTVVAVTAGTAANTRILTVSGGLAMHADQAQMHYAPQVSVTVGANTTVSEPGQSGSFTYESLSVGQLAQFSGTLGQDSAGNPTLDASTGNVNLLPTRIEGTVAAAPAGGVVTLNLQSIDGLSTTSMPAIFNFSGTGKTSTSDAVATAYTVAVPAGLSTSGLATGTPVEFVGFVTAFGAAATGSQADFSAITLVNFANTAADLSLQWARPGYGTLADFTVTKTGLGIANAALSAVSESRLRIGFEASSLASLTSGLQIVPDPTATTPVFYAIGNLGSWNIATYSTWSDFSTALTTALSASTTTAPVTVQQIYARGPYAAATGTLSADQMIVVLGN